MEAFKVRPVSNTVAFASIIFCFVVSFATLIHVELELHAHRRILDEFRQQEKKTWRGENLLKQVTARNEGKDSVLEILQSDLDEGRHSGL